MTIKLQLKDSYEKTHSTNLFISKS